MLKSSTLAATVLVAGMASLPALADSPNPWYLSLHTGLAILQDADNSGDGLNIESDFDNGLAIGGAVGYRFTPALRAELEASYHQNDYNQLTITEDGGLGLLGASIDADGESSVFTAMANGYYDIDTGTAVTPFIGAGIGLAHINNEASAGGIRLVDDSDTVFAYQAKVGAAYAITESLSLDAAYTYRGTQDVELEDTDGESFDTEYGSHSFTVGLRFAF